MKKRRWSLLLSICVLILVFVASILQLIALVTTKWAEFTARVDLGKPKEDGHYGLWSLCTTKAPFWTEDCNPLDTFFKFPPFTEVAGILAIIHLVQLIVLLPLGAIRVIQIVWSMQSFSMKSKVLGIAKVAISFVTVIFAILVAIFVSVDEIKPEYTLKKGWSFWIQLSVIVVDFITVALCVAEYFLFWRKHVRDRADPLGHQAETYGNPAFDHESPTTSPRNGQHQDTHNGSVCYTEASGEPYPFSEIQSEQRNAHDSHILSSSPIIKDNAAGKHRLKRFGLRKESNFSGTASVSPDDITYENPSFRELSPNSIKRAHRR